MHYRSIFGAFGLASWLLLNASAASAAVCAVGNTLPGSSMGANPSGAQFCNVPSTSGFVDDYFFTLTGAPSFTAIANASNSSNPAIDGWKMSLFFDADGSLGGDTLINPPGTVSGSGGPGQTIAMNAFSLAPNTGSGRYYLEFTGNADSSGSIYNGNITTFAVPGPIVGAGLPGLVAACLGLVALARRRHRALAS